MSRLGLFLVAFAAVGCNVALSKYSIEEAGLRVIFPSDSKKTMKMAMADFGKAKYGGALRGQLVYPVTNKDEGPGQMMCAPAPCQYGCTPFNKTFPRPYKIAKEPGKFYIMMLDRGPNNVPNVSACLFLDKVFNAQMAGADAVLVANDRPDDLSTAIAPEDDDTAKELESLTVSAAMISQADADYLRGLLKGGQSVTLQLSWDKTVPQASQVNWEFWTSSEDGCGAACSERVSFMQNIKDQAQNLEKANLTRFTPRYFLWDCPPEELDSAECKRDCVANGTYCALDPEVKPYTGQNVLEMNVRGACFYKLASAVNKGWLWWDYATQMATNCSMKDGKFNAACATTVFDALSGSSLAADGTSGKTQWEACSAFNAAATSFPMLAETLAAQLGNETQNITGVAILPSVRVNNVQYRGSLEAGSVLRAICAGFRSGEEPAVCNTDLVSEDECKEGGAGYIACMSGEKAAAGMTRCINTFSGYSCECKAGTQLYTDPLTNEERCEDLNECLATNVALQQEACKCDRCACVNKIGSYSCTGPLDDMCTAKYNYGSCWSQTINGTFYHACKDAFQDFKALAARGERNETGPWFRCECPTCFESDNKGGCQPRCDLSVCDRVTGFCPGKDDPAKASDKGSGGGGGSGGSSKGNGGPTAGLLILAALGSALLTGVVVLVANRHLMRQRMGDEIRDIMAQYMPLQAANAGASGGGGAPPPGARGPPRVIRPDEDSDEEGHVGAYGWPAARPAAPQASAAALGPLGPLGPRAEPPSPSLVAASQRAVWGPAPVTAPAPAKSAPPAAPAPAPARAAVDVFTISGSEEAAGDAPGTSSNAGALASSGSDPLLGLALGSSTSLDAKAKSPAANTRRGAEGEDNPFL